MSARIVKALLKLLPSSTSHTWLSGHGAAAVGSVIGGWLTYGAPVEHGAELRVVFGVNGREKYGASMSTTMADGFAHFLADPPQRFPDGRWYACYRVRHDYGGRCETDSETSCLFRTEGEARQWYEQEAARLGFADAPPPLAH